MKTLTRVLLAVLAISVFTACGTTAQAGSAGSPGSNPYAPQPADSAMMRGDIRVASADLRVAESYPPQVFLHFEYFQPTPCFSLRVEPSQPDAQNQIRITAYAVAPKDKACTLMALATPLKADLSLGSFPKGHYSVLLNGSKVGEFDS
jgi:hypothetical protein